MMTCDCLFFTEFSLMQTHLINGTLLNCRLSYLLLVRISLTKKNLCCVSVLQRMPIRGGNKKSDVAEYSAIAPNTFERNSLMSSNQLPPNNYCNTFLITLKVFTGTVFSNRLKPQQT